MLTTPEESIIRCPLLAGTKHFEQRSDASVEVVFEPKGDSIPLVAAATIAQANVYNDHDEQQAFA